MRFTIELEYTPRCPQPGMPFTEASFVRRNAPFEFGIGDIGFALVDLWNFGWEDGPVGETLGPELSVERGSSHARRKRKIIEERIAPAVDELRRQGVQIFHCNHTPFLEKYPQWLTSTTEEEREALAAKQARQAATVSSPPGGQSGIGPPQPDWPPADWIAFWREQHRERVWRMKEWGQVQGREV